jgi:hypothetical protein
MLWNVECFFVAEALEGISSMWEQLQSVTSQKQLCHYKDQLTFYTMKMGDKFGSVIAMSALQI